MFLRKCHTATASNSFHTTFINAAAYSSAKPPIVFPMNFSNHFRRYSRGLVSINSPSISKHLSFIRKSFSRSPHPQIINHARQYSVQNLFRLTETSASQLQPYLDVDNVIRKQDLLQNSINKRNLVRKDVKQVEELLKKAQEYKSQKEQIQKLREENTTQCQELISKEINKETKSEELKNLKEKGRQFRDEIREAENKFNEVNDQLVDFIISLPNVLDKDTPDSEATFLNEVQPEKIPPWDDPEYTVIETQCAPGLLAEFAVGKSAWLDIDLRGRAQAHLLDKGYTETGNAEYVKRIILAGAGMDHTRFLRIREPNAKKGLEHATYLAGGASFPSFLALFAQSVIEDPSVFPLRYFVIGRSYESQKGKTGFYQSHGVQVLIACQSAEEMQREFQSLQSTMESFYSKKVGFPFQTKMVAAPNLNMYEQKKLEFVTKASNSCPSKVIGSLSIVGDYVSKRLLCCYFDDKRQAQFLHLISATFFDITHFLRSPNPKLISHADILARAKPTSETLTFDHIKYSSPASSPSSEHQTNS